MPGLDSLPSAGVVVIKHAMRVFVLCPSTAPPLAREWMLGEPGIGLRVAVARPLEPEAVHTAVGKRYTGIAHAVGRGPFLPGTGLFIFRRRNT